VRHPRKTHSHAAEHGADHQTIHVVSTSPNPAGEAANNNKGTIALDATPSVNGGAEIVPRTISAALADLDTADKKQAKMQIWNLPVGGVTKKVAVLATDTPDAIVSGGGGGGGDYNPLIAWKAGQIAYVANTMTISGILILAGTYLAIQDSPVDSLGNPVLPTGGQVPQFPVPAVGAYWRHSAFGDQPVTSCSNLVAIFSVNASAPLSL
jgi:hypothetical protein